MEFPDKTDGTKYPGMGWEDSWELIVPRLRYVYSLCRDFRAPPVLDTEELGARACEFIVHELMRPSKTHPKERARYFRHWVFVSCVRNRQREFGRDFKRMGAFMSDDILAYFAASAEAPPPEEQEGRFPILHEAIGRLTPSYRDLVRRHFIAGQSTLQIAEERGTKKETVRVLCGKAVNSLRRLISRAGAAEAVKIASGVLALLMAVPGMAGVPQTREPTPAQLKVAITRDLYAEVLVLRELVRMLRDQVEELEEAQPPPVVVTPPPTLPYPYSEYERMTWRYIDTPLGSDHVYLHRREPIDAEEWAKWDPETFPPPVVTPPPEPPPNSESLVIEAEDFSRAYDLTPANLGNGNYTPAADPSVDIEVNPVRGGFHIAYFAAGEWLEYDIPPLAAGVWGVMLSIAAPGGGGSISATFDDQSPLTCDVPDSGGWARWINQTIVGTFTLGEGRHRLRITGQRAGASGHVGNLDYLRLVFMNPIP